eukprot:gene28252-34994_t
MEAALLELTEKPKIFVNDAGTIEQRPDHGGSQHVAAEHELAVHRIAHD